MKKERLHTKGVSLVEALLASALFVLVVSTFIGAVIFGTETTALSGHRERAVALAQEGLAAARSVRGDDAVNLADGSFGVATTSSEYVLTGSSDSVGIFTRVVSVVSVDANRKDVTSRVTWQQNAQRTGLVELLTRFTNWAVVVTGVGDWTNPSEESNLDISGGNNGWKVDVAGDYAYVVRTGGNPDFVVVDISNPASPSQVGSLSLSGGPEDISVAGDYAYVASDSNSQELQIIDISTPSSPSLVGTFNNPGNSNMWAVYAVGTTVYLGRDSGSGSEFYIVNASAPALPVLVGSVDIGSDVNDIWVSGSYAYLATDGDELQVVDISAPISPSVVADINLSSGDNGEAIAGNGDTVILGRIGSTGRFHTIDISTPTSPSELDSYNIGDDIRDVALTSDAAYAFVVGDENDFEFVVLDISTPSSITLAGDVNVNNDLNGVAYYENGDRAVAVGENNSAEVRIFKPQ